MSSAVKTRELGMGIGQMTTDRDTIPGPFQARGRIIHSPLSSGMRRSKSAGDKFVFGARRRTLTPISRKDITGDREPGITSPRPNRISRQKSNYTISEMRQQYPDAYDPNETEQLQKFLFSRDRTKNTIEEDIARLMKLLFTK